MPADPGRVDRAGDHAVGARRLHRRRPRPGGGRGRLRDQAVRRCRAGRPDPGGAAPLRARGRLPPFGGDRVRGAGRLHPDLRRPADRHRRHGGAPGRGAGGAHPHRDAAAAGVLLRAGLGPLPRQAPGAGVGLRLGRRHPGGRRACAAAAAEDRPGPHRDRPWLRLQTEGLNGAAACGGFFATRSGAWSASACTPGSDGS
ncbi:hypothetical protein SGPA1_60289 [Streptomyces misionensis JCM 4497]